MELNCQDVMGLVVKETAQNKGHQNLVELIDDYEKDKEKTIEKLRNELGLKRITKQQMFIYYCADGQLYQLKRLISSRKRLF